MVRHREVRLLTMLIGFVFLAHAVAVAASKPHTLTFGKWVPLQWGPDQWSPDSTRSPEGEPPLALPSTPPSTPPRTPPRTPPLTPPLTIKVRPLLIDAHLKEFTLGAIHEVTDRLFVVRRAFRV